MAPVGHRDVVAGEELLALIFEEVHGGRGLYKPPG
jgi:hypothetical protein